MRRRTGVILLCLLTVVCGCGGGGGGSGGGGGGSGGGGSTPTVSGNHPAAASGPGDASGYFPVAVGSTWLFDEGNTLTGLSTNAVGQYSISVTGTKTVSGANSSVFTISDTAPGAATYEQYYAVSGGGVTNYGDNQATDPITNQIIPFAELLFPVTPGPVSQINASNLNFGKDSAGNSITASFNQQIQMAAFETVTTGAGVFPNCAKVVTSISGSATDAATHQTIPVSGTDTAWYAPGVGEVQETLSATVNGTTTTTAYAARGYTLNGVAHGLGFTSTAVASNVALPSNWFGPFIATDGAAYLIASNQTGGVAAYLIDATGAVKVTLNIAFPAGKSAQMVAFDGTNYEIFFDPAYVASGSGGAIEFLVQRISPMGVLVDAAPYTVSAPVPNPSLQLASVGYVAAGSGNIMAFVYSSFPQELIGVLVAPGSAAATAFQIASTYMPNGGGMDRVQAVFDGTNYFVTWTAATATSSAHSILGIRVTQAGTVVDAAPIVISNATGFASGPAVTYGSGNYLVAWNDTSNPAAGTPQVYSALLSAATGARLDAAPGSAGQPVSPSIQTATSMPTVAYNGTEYLVTWVEAIAGGSFVRAARLSVAGMLTSGPGYEIPISTSGSAVAEGPAVSLPASGGPGLIAWYGNNVTGNIFQLMDVVVHPF